MMYGHVFWDVLYMYNTDHMGADHTGIRPNRMVRRRVFVVWCGQILTVHGRVFGDVLYMYNTDRTVRTPTPE